MEENTNTAVVRDFGQIVLKKNDGTLALAIDSLLKKPECFNGIKPFFMNGGICGHKVMDIKGAVDILKKHDEDKTLQPYPLNDFKLGNALKNRLRSRYDLDKKWKIVGENENRVIGVIKDAA
jgi:hypothetical protein